MDYFLRILGNAGRAFVRAAVRFYYGPIVVQNPERIPAQGALLVTANHPNSLLDPVLVGLTVKRPVHFLAKAPLFSIPVFGQVLKAFGMIPAFRKQDEASEVKDNMASLQEGVEVLKRSEVLGIFPEGKSHDELKVDQVKTGAARMAVDAYEKGMTRLVVLPIGLNYEQKDRFRSAVWVVIGEPIQLHDWMKEAPVESRQAMRELNREIDRALKGIVIHLEDLNRGRLLKDLDSLLQDENDPVRGILRRKNIASAINHFLKTKPFEVEPLANKITEFSEKLRSSGLRADLPVFQKSKASLFWNLLTDFLALLPGLLVALAGTAYYLVPFCIVRLLTIRLRTPGNTTTATTRLLLSVPHYIVWTVYAWFALRMYFLPWVVWTLTALAPFAGMVAISFWPALIRKSKHWFRQVQLLADKERCLNLRRERDELKKELLVLDENFTQEAAGRFVPPQPLPGWWTPLRVLGVVLLLATATLVYVIASLPKSHPLALDPVEAPDLSSVPAMESGAQLGSDEKAFVDILAGLQSLRESTAKLEDEFKQGTRTFYRQEDNDAVRAQLLSYLNYRNALFRLIWKYQGHASLSDTALRARAELLQFASAAVLFESSTRFIARFAGQDEIIRKLNEPEPQWNVPPNLYDDIRRNLTHPQNRSRLQAAWKNYMARLNDYRTLGLVEGEPYRQIHQGIRQSIRGISAFSSSLWPDELSLLARDVVHVGLDSKYYAGSLVSCWIGDTRIRAPRDGKPLIQSSQLEVLQNKLQPGDIILERRNWFLSNAFLPGYWPHAALYIGTPAQLEKMGLKDDPRVRKAWDEFQKTDAAGHPHVILESMSEGVIFSSLEHSIGGADSVAVLRPHLLGYQTKEVLGRAFSHQGKPYDFDFDFFSTDKLVCTELVFRSYDGYLNFELVDILGRKTLPAIEIVRAFQKDQKEKKPKLEFIAFLDGDESKSSAEFSGEAAFLGTLNRPPLTWLQSLVKE